MTTHGPAWLAWSIGAFAVASAVAGMVLLLRNVPALDQVLSGFTFGGVVFGVSFATVGAVIAARRPENPVGWIFLAIGLSQGFDSFDTEYAQYALVTHPSSLPGGTFMAWLAQWTFAPGAGLLPLSLLLFPTGRPPSPRWRWVAWVVAVAIGLMVVPVAVVTWPMRTEIRSLTEPFAIPVFVQALTVAGTVLVWVSLVAAAAAVIVRFRRARGEERQQLKWLVFAGALTAMYVGSVFYFEGPPMFQGPGVVIGLALLLVAVPSIPIAAGIAILRYRLYDIEVIIRRTLVYTVLTALLGLAYFGSIVVLQNTFGAFTRQRDSTLVTVLSTLVIAALFVPLRRRVQAFIDRRFYRRKYDAAQTLAAFSNAVRDEVELGRLAERLTEVVVETLQPVTVSLWLKGQPAPFPARLPGGRVETNGTQVPG